MQDRYAGDVGDFVKLGLLRALMPGRKLGLAWYRFPDEAHNKDGRHIGYLERPETWEALDPELFAHLGSVVLGTRTIASLEPALPGAVTADEALDVSKIAPRERRAWRRGWFLRTMEQLDGCEIVFADPDNGLVGDEDWRKGRATFGKQIPLQEAVDLADGRCAVIYHHNTRRAGGHSAEVDHWMNRLGLPCLAVRASAFSPRTFFVVNPDTEIADRTRAFCDRWAALSVRLHATSDQRTA